VEIAGISQAQGADLLRCQASCRLRPSCAMAGA
jgi:hypothetical protein